MCCAVTECMTLSEHNKSLDKYLYNRDGVYLAKGSAQDVVTSKSKIGRFSIRLSFTFVCQFNSIIARYRTT